MGVVEVDQCVTKDESRSVMGRGNNESTCGARKGVA